MSTRRTRLIVAGAALAMVPLAISATAKPASSNLHFKTLLLPTGSYGEPSLAVSNKGLIAISTPGCGGVCVWHSSNGGQSFAHTSTTSTNGGGDSELDFLPNGDLMSADLEVEDSNVKMSHDGGATWDKGQPVGIEQDRQWFAHSPDGKTEYLVYHDFVAEGEFYAKSTDGGKTWSKQNAAIPIFDPKQAANAPGAVPGQTHSPSIIDQGVNTFSGPMLVDQKTGELYVLYAMSDAQSNALGGITPPFGPVRSIVLAHSKDGTNWTASYAVDDHPQGTDVQGKQTPVNAALFPWGSIDSAGNLYCVFASDRGSPGHFHIYYTYSTNHGATFSKPIKVDKEPLTKGVHMMVTGAAGANGVLDLAWYTSDTSSQPGDPLGQWHVDFAQIRHATSTSRHTVTYASIPTVMHRKGICTDGTLCAATNLGPVTAVGGQRGDRSLADFFELAIGPDGMAQIAYASNADDKGVVWAKQQGGKSALIP